MSPFLAPPPSINQPVVIYNDGGGLVDRYIAQAHQYNIEGRRVEIRGSCRSACLLALSVKNVCVGQAAQVKAHHAYEKSSGITRPDVTETMLVELPLNIRRRLDGKIQENYTAAATLEYSDLRKLNIPDCDKTTVATDTPKQKTIRNADTKIRLLNPLSGLVNILSGVKNMAGR